MSKKITKCKVCNAEIASNAKSCPQCGAKNKKPIYKKWWFWLIIVLVVAGGSSGTESQPSEPKTAETTQQTPTETAPVETISYTHYNVTELFDALERNALKAESDFKNQYVEIEGYLSVIDSSGKYISVGAAESDWDYAFQTVHCSLKNDEQRNQIMKMSKGDVIVVRGRITDVGEVLGYYLSIDSIG